MFCGPSRPTWIQSFNLHNTTEIFCTIMNYHDVCYTTIMHTYADFFQQKYFTPEILKASPPLTHSPNISPASGRGMR